MKKEQGEKIGKETRGVERNGDRRAGEGVVAVPGSVRSAGKERDVRMRWGWTWEHVVGCPAARMGQHRERRSCMRESHGVTCRPNNNAGEFGCQNGTASGREGKEAGGRE
jgi:hypothetical protein